MGDEEKIPDDPRTEFFGAIVIKQTKIKPEKWNKMASQEESKEIIMKFLNDVRSPLIVFYTNAGGVLLPSLEFSPAAKGKTCYFIRRGECALALDNMRTNLTFGNCSDRPIKDLQVLVDEVYVPILTNTHNQGDWPSVVKKDIEKQLQTLRNNIAEVQGNINNLTILPLPITISKVMENAPAIENGNTEACTIGMKNSLEEIVLKWAHSIAEIINEDLFAVFKKKNRPVPDDEFNFWNGRMKNLENIYDQLRDTRIKTIGMILEKIQSVYSGAFRSTFQNVVESLHEAKDITLHFLPLKLCTEKFEMEDFTDVKDLIVPLTQNMGLMWTRSKYYATNERMVHLFRLLHNLFIEQAKLSLDPSSIFQGEVDDSILKVSQTIDILDYYKSIHTKVRDMQTTPWTIRPEAIFTELDQFINRMHEVRDLFLMTAEFLKLEKVEIGGIKGRQISRKITEIFEEFKVLYTQWVNTSNKYDLLDADIKLKDFDREKKLFVKSANELERKLALQFDLAFDECYTTCHSTKLLEMLGTILDRPIINKQIKRRYPEIVNVFAQELDLVKEAFDSGVANINKGGLAALPVALGLPPTSGVLKWVRQLRQRILKPYSDFPYIPKEIFDNDPGKYTIMQYEAMMGILDDFEKQVLNVWKENIGNIIKEELDKPFLRREGDILRDNFSYELVSALKETKLLKNMKYEDIPEPAIDLSDIEEILWSARLKVFRIVEWYNVLIEGTEPCEYELVREEIVEIDKNLVDALTVVKWNDYDITYIESLYDEINALYTRVMRAQSNLNDIIMDIQDWGSKPLYARKDGNNEALLNCHPELIFLRLERVVGTRKMIDRLINDENFRLFFNMKMISCPCSEDEEEDEADEETGKSIGSERKPEEMMKGEKKMMSRESQTSSHHLFKDGKFRTTIARSPYTFSKIERTQEQKDLYRPYEEYVDRIIGQEIMGAIRTSILYMKNVIENNLEHNAPVFEIKMELDPPNVIFKPDIFESQRRSFLTVVEELIIDVYMMSDMIPRILPSLSEPEIVDGVPVIQTYEMILCEDKDIDKLRQAIVNGVEEGIKLVTQFFNTKLKKYQNIWRENRARYLEHFLEEGCGPDVPPSTDEMNLFYGNEEPEVKKRPKSKPTLDDFRSEIDRYKDMKAEVMALKDTVDFNVFLRLNCRSFKHTLLKELTEWSLLFKDYLKNHVINSLQELNDFCQEAMVILTKEIGKNDLSELLDVMFIINKVEERQMDTDKMFDPLKAIMTMLKSYQFEFDNSVYIQFIELPEKWNIVKKTVLNIKQTIAPMQAYQVDLIGKRVLLFETRTKLYRKTFLELPFFHADCPNAYPSIDKSNRELTLMKNQIEMLNESTVLFNLAQPDKTALEKCMKEIKSVKQLWDFVNIIQSSIEFWRKTPWQKIDVEGMDSECKKFGKELRMLDKDMRSWDPYIEAEASLKNLMTSLRAVTELQNPAIRERHWQELMDTTHVRFEMTKDTTLADLLDLHLHRYEEDVKNIVDKSVKEMAMEKVLKDLNATWSVMEFEYEPHARTGLKLLRLTEEIIEVLEEHQVQLQTMLTSKYIAFFLEEVSNWQNLLSNADAVRDAWFEVQRKWSYLESIFIGSEDIRRQLPEDSKRFDKIDSDFKTLLSEVGKQPNIVKATNIPGLYDKLETIQSQLILCEKALNDYLETKRLAYPRFYFVSSADLLDILSNGNQPRLVARHLTKLYDSLAKMLFTEGTKNAHTMQSKENDELVPFKKMCDCSGQVELWLNRVTECMRLTLHELFRQSIIAYEDKPRHKWVFDWPAQPALCTTQIYWSSETTVAFHHLEEGYENAMKDYQKKQITQLNTLITLLLDDLSGGDRQKIMTICTIDVHSRDVVSKMILMRTENAAAFQWQAQLRHRWDLKLDDCYVNICDAQFKYDFEYLGNTPRLVITPLTDRCYITLTQSLHLVMGGAPAGPAGTGKTETTKDLGKGLGIMVYVFNCSEQMDYKSCGNIYKGLSQTGAWGCFDEFNRISVEVLSVVAVQVKSILDAIKMHKHKFNFLGEMIVLVPTVGMFITMNPGYAGRTELPENLKALFRPCAMVVPDFALISEIMLVAEGFTEARLLSRKFITLYTLCKELLSKQDHYDWGLRAIKSVLVVAGALKRGDRDRPEDQVLMRALRDFNIPKIVTEDVPVFMGLIGDLFPNLDVPRKRDVEFEAIIKKSAIDLQLQPEDGFVLKVVQLEELFAVRHSVFINGFSGTGKSEVWKTLNRTYYNQKRKPYYNDLNPKAVTNNELFGVINPATREWRDGLFSVIMRDQANMSGTGPKWIVLDGDIDPMWIESLNTLMDDNKILTLASNERIALTKEMRLLFEIASLRTATPATVSRAGILYINPQDLGWNPFVASWVSKREIQSEKATLSLLFDKYIPPLLEVMKSRLKKITPISEIAMIQMTCFLLDCLLTPQNLPSDSPKDWYEIYFAFAILWGFGSALFQDQIVDWRNEFNKWWINEFKTVRFPAGGTIFNYYIDQETKAFLPWSNLVEDFELDTDIPLQSTLVNTAETTRLRYFMDILIEAKHPVMFVGGAGSGKSVIVYDKLKNLPAKYAITNVPFNFYTTSGMLQQVLEKPLEKKAGRNFGPPGNKTMIYFIDDLNMPEVDTYGTVSPHTLIRQFMDYQHWYDRQKLILKDIHNCMFISCMNPTAGSFTIDPRLQRHFCTFAVNFPNQESMFHIYNSIFSQHIANPANKIRPTIALFCEVLIRTAINLHVRMNQMFLPTAIKFHYNFSMRDLANIFSGMMFASGDCLLDKNTLIRLWIHEANRVYGDKLVDFDDLKDYDKLVLDTVRKNVEDMTEEIVFQKPLIYFHYAESINDAKYMPVKSWVSLNAILEEGQENYNELVGALNLVLFEDAMAHICRICRILSNDRGYALLIGVGGSGKQSLTRLACFICMLDVFQTQLRKGFSMNDLRIDLAVLFVKAGVKNNMCCYLMTDSQVAEENFLVLINDLLASGEIPDMFAGDEIENIINGVRNEVKQAGINDNRENCWKYFIDKVRRMLKIVLCFSPVGSTLRVRARKFPAVVNCTSIDWFHEWPRSALESVSNRFLAEIDTLPTALVDSVAQFMAFVHGSVNEMSIAYLQNEKRYNYTTPKSFLELIALYSKLFKEKHFECTDRIERLENGLLKLADCAAQVDGLQDQLKVQEVILAVKQEEANVQLAIVSAENEKVSKERAVASEKEKAVRLIEEDVSVKTKTCAEDLKKVEPVMIAAEAALDTLDKNSLTELKSFGSPPQIVVDVISAVIVLFAKNGKIPKDRSWKTGKTLMGKVDKFIENLKNYDKKNIHPDIIKAITPYLNDPEFNPEIIRAKSAAAAGICEWVININKFYEVYLIVGPKERALISAENELKSAQRVLEDLNERLGELQDKLDVLQFALDKAQAEKDRFQAEADKTEYTINLAHRLVNGLASEKVRWRDSVQRLNENIITLPGDILLISCFISYVGCFTRRYRVELQNDHWLPTFARMQPSIPVSEGSDPLEMICDDAMIASWNNEGLPSDRMSSENATILTNSARWPLMIDPQLQGIKWIKQKYGKSLVVIRLTQRGYLDKIEKAVSHGNVMLMEFIGENVDAVLDPLLGRVLVKKGKVLKMGDREVDYHPNFRLILQTKLANPHYKPEMQAQTTLINFTVTKDGLEDQLLAEVVKAERPDLEELKSNLTTQQNVFKITLKTLEDDLLHRLSTAGENVLEDPTLVLNLEKTKKTAEEIEVKVKEARITSAQIDEAREIYRPAAERSSLIYFILNDLFKINRIYQFSLKAFTVVFHNAIKNTPPAETLHARVANLLDSISYAVYTYTSRALFERDKLTFMAQLTIQILLQTKSIDTEELNFLLRYPYVPVQYSPFDFLTPVAWGGIKALAAYDNFKNLDKDLESYKKRWKTFTDAETPERETLPGEWKGKSGLQKLCIMRCLRPDRMTYAVKAFVESELGKKYVEVKLMTFAETFLETSNVTHTFFTLSPGVDPIKVVEALGQKLKFSSSYNNFHNVSLGQGQEIVAENAIDVAAEYGHWVMLQNIHLVAKWLPVLEKKIEGTLEKSHENYRLFVTAEPAPAPEFHILPQGILESAVKITNEPPTGMNANLHKSLDNFSQETLEMCSKEAEFKAILFALCYFHAVVAERRKFGPQGWNRVYPFNFGDLTISTYVLYNYLEANSKVPWEDLRYLFGEIMYGGHITDDWDRRLCATYLEEFMQPELVDGELFFAPGFAAPPNTDFVGYHNYITAELPAESPILYGLHPNAEVGVLTFISEQLFKTIFELQPRDSGASSSSALPREEILKTLIEDTLDKIPEEFNMFELSRKVEDKTPFIIVALQECDRMNMLMREIKRSLSELFSGLKGELTISTIMEALMEALLLDIVPDRWAKLAYPSQLGLQAWFSDLLLRLKELEAWAADFNLPSSVWLAGFFNPQSFLTAIMQQTARKNSWPLDRMCLNCDVTRKQKQEFTAPPREGAYINGLYMEGARWDMNLGTIAESKLKELFPAIPVVYVKAVTQDKQDVKNVYECPLYKIRLRGPTYVWTLNLKTKEKAAKWTLAGVCLLLQI